MDKISSLLFIKTQSDRIPGKNFRLFNGKPLFEIILDRLSRLNLFDEIIVDSDNEEVLSYVSEKIEKGVPITRDKDLLGNHISANELIAYDIEYSRSEHIFQTHCTNPLLTETTIRKAVEFYFNSLPSNDSVFSVTKIQNRLYDAAFNPVNHTKDELKKTQDLPPVFIENSSFFIFSKSSFKNANSNRIGISPSMYEIASIEGIDIDYEHEFRLAEMISRNKCDFPDIFQDK